MRRPSLTFLLFLLLPGRSRAQASHVFDCQPFAPVPSVVKEGSVEGSAAADFMKGAFTNAKIPPLSGSLKAKIQVDQHDVLSKYPNADRLALRQQEMYLTCQALNADPKLSTAQRIQYIQSVGEGVGMPSAETKKRVTAAHLSATPKKEARPEHTVPATTVAPQSAPSSNAQAPQILPNCSGNCAQNNYGSQIQQFGAARPAPEAWFRVQPFAIGADGPKSAFQQGYGNPGVHLTMGAKGRFTDAKFRVTCDRPCDLYEAMITTLLGPGSSKTTNQLNYDVGRWGNRLDVIGFLLSDPATLSPNQALQLTVMSRDREPINVTSAESLSE